MKALEEAFGLSFSNSALLKEALTHSSYAHEHNLPSNERLEFIGDAVLDLIIADYLMQKTPLLSEGEMTKFRARFVNEKALIVYAKKAKLDDYILLGIGEEKSGGRLRGALIADAFEAFLGAIYLDKGLLEVMKVTDKVVIPELQKMSKDGYKDYKSMLQELVQSDHRQLSYQTVKEEGPSHNKWFTVHVMMDDILMGIGHGSSKKEAAQEAAHEALNRLVKRDQNETHL
jgi:ribonuclease-3